jgi:hypothetical protein
VRDLRKSLAKVANGEGFLLQARRRCASWRSRRAHSHATASAAARRVAVVALRP